MASGNGELEIIQATRELLIEDPLLSDEGVFLTFAPAVDDVPYVLFQVVSNVGLKVLDNTDAWRLIRLQVKSVGAARGNQEGIEIAGELQSRAYQRFFETIDGETAKARWNRLLNPLGWNAESPPMEKGGIGPYSDRVVELVRWHMGHFADLRISRT